MNENQNPQGDVVPVESGPVRSLQPRSNTEIDLSTPEGIEQQTKRIEAYVSAQVRIRSACIRVTNVNDWTDMGGKPYLQWVGAAKVAGIFGISYDTPKFSEKYQSDESGSYVEFNVETMVRYGGRSVPEIGSASTRDGLYGVGWRTGNDGKKEKYFLPLSEVDVNDVKKKSLTNLLNRGIRSLLGLSFTWEEIEKITNGAITQAKCSKVGFDKGKQGGSTEAPDTAELRSKVRKQLLEICGGDEAGAKARLQKLTTFKGKDGKEVPGRTSMDAVSEKQLTYLAKDVEKEHKAMFPDGGQGEEVPQK